MKIRHQLTTALLLATIPLSTFAAATNTTTPNAAAKLTPSPAQLCANTVAVLNARSARLSDTKAAAVKHYADARKVWVGRVATASKYETKKTHKTIKESTYNAYLDNLDRYDKAVKVFATEYDTQVTQFRGMNVNCTAAGRKDLNAAIALARTGRTTLLANQKAVHDIAVDHVIPRVKDIIDQFHAMKATKEGLKVIPLASGGEG